MQQSSIDQLFRSARTTEPYIEDKGFSARVQNEIRRRQLSSVTPPSKLSVLILILATALGVGFFYQLSPVEFWVTELLAFLNSGLTLAVAAVSSLLFALVVALLLALDRI